MRHNDSTALAYALGAFTLMSLGDATIKSMAGEWPGPAIAALRYTFGAIALGALLWWKEGRSGFALPHPGWQMVRGVAIGGSMVAFVSAVFMMPLASATAISFTSPMLTALLAALLLGEPARRETWVASAVAFVGVLIVLRPNFAALGWLAVLPLFSAMGMALLMIGNRAVAGRASALGMQFSLAAVAALVLVPIAVAGHLSGVAFFHAGLPHWSVLARIVAVTCSASTAHWLLYQATLRAGAATIAPMTYVQLLLATGIGWAVFGERPDAMALLGACVIVAAGLYLWRKGRVREVAVTE